MSSPQRVPIPLRNKLAVYLGIVFIGLPVLVIWVLFHLGAIDLICNCVAYNMFPERTPTSIWIAGLLILPPLLFADWSVWTRWRSYTMEKIFSKVYAEQHVPWYAKTGDDRPTELDKNKYYET